MAISDVVDAAEAGKILGVSATAVHALAQRGTLPSSWLAGKRVWKRAQVLALRDDPEYQKRSRKAGQLRLDGMELTTEEAVRHAQSIKAQAPIGFDPVGKRAGGPR